VSAPAPSRPVPIVVEVVEEIGCAQNILADDRWLAAGGPGIRVAVLADRAVSVGVGVPLGSEALDRIRADGVPVLRRSSGGTAVAHAPGDLAWSVVLPRSHPRVGTDFVRAYDRWGEGPVEFLSALGIEGRWAEPPGLTEQYCLLSGRGQVLTVDGRVLGGAAQHATASAVLHHGILPLVVDGSKIARWFDLDPARTSGTLTSLDALGVRTAPARLATELATAISRTISTPPRTR